MAQAIDQTTVLPIAGSPAPSPVADVAVALREAVSVLRRRLPGRPEDGAATSLVSTLARIGPVRATELAEHACLDRSTVSRHLRRLEESGYVERRPDPEDGRAALLRASPAGLAHSAAHFAGTVATLEAALSSWPAADVTALAALLRRLAHDLEAS